MKITCAKKGSINDFISAIDDRIMELEDGVDSSSKVNSWDTIMSADEDLNTQYIDEIMKKVSNTIDQQVTLDATYEIGKDAINITVSFAGKVFDIEVPFEDLVWDNKDSDIDYIVEGIINAIND